MSVLKKIILGRDGKESDLDLRLLSVLFSVVLSTVVMYYYDSRFFPAFGFFIVSVILQLTLYYIYGYTANKTFPGVLAGFAVSAVLILIALGFINLQPAVGESDTAMAFGLWFLTPQSALPHFEFYTYSMAVFTNMFIFAVVYYFTVIRYRTVMTFGIVLIPFLLYARELTGIPISLTLVVLAVFFALMAAQPTGKIKAKLNIVKNRSYYATLGLFIAATAVLTLILPKPVIRQDRSVVEGLISAERLTDRFLASLNMLTETTDGGRFSTLPADDRPLFFVNAPERLVLKTKVYDEYMYDRVGEYNADVWRVNRSIMNLGSGGLEGTGLKNPLEFLNAVQYACETGSGFAEKYGLLSFMTLPVPGNGDLPGNSITVRANNISLQAMLVPANVFDVDRTYRDRVRYTAGGEIVNARLDYFSSNARYDVYYFSQSILKTPKAADLLLHLNRSVYDGFLTDLASAVAGTRHEEYVKRYRREFDFSNYYFDAAVTPERPRVQALADSITRGLESDFEKAAALESYFAKEGFVYDLGYQKTRGDNAETFLFDSKTGICYEFATAMTLMARAAGLPARYVEGFAFGEYDERVNAYRITAKESHAYTEVFISGYGWIAFEPTVADYTAVTAQKERDFTMLYAGLGIGLGIAALLVFVIVILPAVREWLFRRKLKKLPSGEVTVRILQRLVYHFKLGGSVTANEMSEMFYSRYSIDFSSAAYVFNKYVYGKIPVTQTEASGMYQLYLSVLDARVHERKRRPRYTS
ncbi:MAG: hypothetical protein LBR54_05010 [Oscillospiraceae bacterium]|jgi:hypothetical protein|nr:hypothetical protein [Oscillospiraceae bacterium]